MFKFKSISKILVLLFVISTIGYSQKESVILYNSQPVKVELSETGNIKSFIGLVPGYMFGYDLTPTASITPEVVTETSTSSEVSQNAGYFVVSSEKIELLYKPNFATLDKSIINKLNEVSAYMRVNPNSNILITAHSTNITGSKLISNRLASSIAYLGIKGVNADRISTEIQQSSEFVDLLLIYFLN